MSSRQPARILLVRAGQLPALTLHGLPHYGRGRPVLGGCVQRPDEPGNRALVVVREIAEGHRHGVRQRHARPGVLA
ncbi:hypothetical protein ABZ835_32620 [Streptomyces sp. NPDC047461]|uniref:hypothetical protein n=1 Tax=Streptomyces sp. NPDC047461 TaxID=3155619 RepID=UPI0033E910DD